MERIHYLDNLRALAMLLGVYLHSALAYTEPARNIWIATDPQGSVAIDASVWFIHLFRMSLFFLLSGYFAKLVIERKGFQHFLRSRCWRVALPFVLFYPFLLAAMTAVFIFALSYVKEPQGLMRLVADAIKNSSSGQKREPLGTMHLWFLYYLAMFTVVACMLRQASWVKIMFSYRSLWLTLFVFPLVLVPSAMAAGTPLPAPESFVPTWWPFAFYGAFFFAGWQWYGRESELDSLQPFTWHMVLGCLLLFIPFYLFMPVLDLNAIATPPNRAVSPRGVFLAVLTSYLSVHLTLASLLLGKKFLNRDSSRLRFIADSSYWIYLVHLPIVLFLQTILIPVPMSLWIKLPVVLLLTMLASLATYVVFVRYTPIGVLLHGKRAFP